jgi:hypothetical protein
VSAATAADAVIKATEAAESITIEIDGGTVDAVSLRVGNGIDVTNLAEMALSNQPPG